MSYGAITGKAQRGTQERAVAEQLPGVQFQRSPNRDAEILDEARKQSDGLRRILEEMQKQREKQIKFPPFPEFPKFPKVEIPPFPEIKFPPYPAPPTPPDVAGALHHELAEFGRVICDSIEVTAQAMRRDAADLRRAHIENQPASAPDSLGAIRPLLRGLLILQAIATIGTTALAIYQLWPR